LLNPNIQERSFPITFFDRTTINIASCSEVEDDTDEEGVGKENYSGETNKTVATLEAMPMRLNLGHIFSLSNDTCKHMVVALQPLQTNADRVKGVTEMPETSV